MRRTSKLFASLATFGTAVGRHPVGEPRVRAGDGRDPRRSRQLAGPRAPRSASASPRSAAASVRAARPPPRSTASRVTRRRSVRSSTPMILGLALIESLVIYALVIAFLLVRKIG